MDKGRRRVRRFGQASSRRSRDQGLCIEVPEDSFKKGSGEYPS